MVFIQCGEVTGHYITAFERMVCYLRFPRRGDTPHCVMQGHVWKRPVGPEAEGVEENVVFIEVFVERKGLGRVGRLSEIKIAYWNNVSGV